MALDVGSRSQLPAVPVPALVDAGASSAPRRPWSATGNNGRRKAAAPVLASPVPFFGEDETLKRDLVAWAKAVASMARESAQRSSLPC